MNAQWEETMAEPHFPPRPQPHFDAADAAAEMRALERRLVANIRAEKVDSGPEAMRVPAHHYTDPNRLAAEKRELFLKLPLLAGLSCEIPNPGDVMLFDAAGPAIVIARGRDRVVRAFLNMCMHRGAQVATECGARNLLTCRFHGWSYDLEGRLVGLPAEDAFDGAAERGKIRLVPVPVGEWAGMIFVKARPGDERIDVAEYLGEMGQQLVRLNIPASQPVKLDHRIDVEANWKFVLNTYGESYHFGTLHPKTFSPLAYSNRNLYDRFGPHYRVLFSPRAYGELVDVDESLWPATPYGGSHFIFPNTIIYGSPWGKGGSILQTYRIYPGQQPGQSFTLMSSYSGFDMPPETTQEELLAVHESTETVVRTEDYSISAEGQRNLESAPDGHEIILGRNEIALQNMHREIDKRLGELSR